MLVCAKCTASFSESEPRWRCDCGGYLILETPALFPRDALRDRPPSLWRYRESLGIEREANVVTLGEGFTPLIESWLGGESVLLKLDYLCPTGSYKDRGSTVMISKLKEWQIPEIIEDSSGNAGASIAAYAALAGIRSNIYIPASSSAGKAAQIAMYGANLVQVSGSREDTAQAAWKAADRIYYATHNWNPYFLTGMKTAAYEIAEQLSWQAPDWVITPAGGGGLLSGLYLGFLDLLSLRMIAKMPHLAAVQSASCDPIYRAWSAGLRDLPAVQKRNTAAEGISVAKPVRGKTILQSIRETGGVATTVTDDLVWEAVEELGRHGIYVEPTAAAAPAAFASLRRDGALRPGERTVIMLTGSGLKATDTIVDHYALRASVLA